MMKCDDKVIAARPHLKVIEHGSDDVILHFHGTRMFIIKSNLDKN